MDNLRRPVSIFKPIKPPLASIDNRAGGKR